MTEKENYSSKVKLNNFDPSLGLDRGASIIKEIAWYFIKVFFFLSAIPYPNSLKSGLLRVFGAKVGKGLVIKPKVNIHFPWKLDIGNHVWIGEEVIILNFEKASIGNNVCISQRSFLCGGNHDFKDPAMRYKNGPITLNDGCWIGACAFIGPKVTIGCDTVVLVGSIITSDLKANLVYRNNIQEVKKERWTSFTN